MDAFQELLAGWAFPLNLAFSLGEKE